MGAGLAVHIGRHVKGLFRREVSCLRRHKAMGVHGKGVYVVHGGAVSVCATAPERGGTVARIAVAGGAVVCIHAGPAGGIGLVVAVKLCGQGPRQLGIDGNIF